MLLPLVFMLAACTKEGTTDVPCSGGGCLPGGGLISYSRYDTAGSSIFTIRAGGTHEQRVAATSALDIHSTWNATGTWVAFSEVGGGSWICSMLPDGSQRQRLTANGHFSLVPSISPDGARIAYTSDEDGNYEVYTMAADGSDVQQLTFTAPPATHVGPKYSPDGTKLLFAFRAQETDPDQDLYLMNTDGSSVERITWGLNNAESRAWSPDGARIVFNNVVDSVGQLFLVNRDGTGLTQLTFNPGTYPALVLGGFFPPMRGDITPAWSPDGQWIAYASDVTGNFDIHMVRPDGGGHRQVTNSPSHELSVGWRPIP